MSVALVPMFVAPSAFAATAVPPPPKPFQGWAGSRQCARRGAELASDAQQDPQPVRQVTAAFTKTRICRFYPGCNKGDDCRFAHSHEELRSRPSVSKTRMCAGFYDGRCKLSPDECGFAHGEEELRAREVPYFGAWPQGSTCGSSYGDITPTTSASLVGRDWDGRDGAVSFGLAWSGSVASSSCGEPTPKAEEVQDEDGGLSGGEREQLELEPETPEVQAILAEWAKRILIMTGAAASGAAAGRSPTAGEFSAALMKAMPDFYED